MSETHSYTTQESFARRFFAIAVAVSLFAAAIFAPGVAGASSRVNVNSAGVEELAALPGIGQSKARAIIEERERLPFGSVDDLERVSGIGEKTLEVLREHVTIGQTGPKALAGE